MKKFSHSCPSLFQMISLHVLNRSLIRRICPACGSCTNHIIGLEKHNPQRFRWACEHCGFQGHEGLFETPEGCLMPIGEKVLN